jgi:nucleoside-diphosphate-sugar epimerase
MRIFVTGASGFIGSHVVKLLIQKGHTVGVLISPDKKLWRLEPIVNQLNLITGRLENLTVIQPELAAFAPEACIHLAWNVEPGKYLHAPDNIAMMMHSLNLLAMLIDLKCQRVVMVGTCAEYDTDIGFLKEDSRTNPTTLYAAAKLSLGTLGQFVATAGNVEFCWARLFYQYGPTEDERRLVPALINALLRGKSFESTEGEQVRDYLHVEDVASALCTLIEKQVVGIVNIASGIPITIRQLIELVGELTGHSELLKIGAVPYRQWEPPFICGANQRLRELGWSPHYTLRSGLQQTIDWWADHQA